MESWWSLKARTKEFQSYATCGQLCNTFTPPSVCALRVLFENVTHSSMRRKLYFRCLKAVCVSLSFVPRKNVDSWIRFFNNLPFSLTFIPDATPAVSQQHSHQNQQPNNKSRNNSSPKNRSHKYLYWQATHFGFLNRTKCWRNPKHSNYRHVLPDMNRTC